MIERGISQDAGLAESEVHVIPRAVGDDLPLIISRVQELASQP